MIFKTRMGLRILQQGCLQTLCCSRGPFTRARELKEQAMREQRAPEMVWNALFKCWNFPCHLLSPSRLQEGKVSQVETPRPGILRLRRLDAVHGSVEIVLGCITQTVERGAYTKRDADLERTLAQNGVGRLQSDGST